MEGNDVSHHGENAREQGQRWHHGPEHDAGGGQAQDPAQRPEQGGRRGWSGQQNLRLTQWKRIGHATGTLALQRQRRVVPLTGTLWKQ